VSLRRAGLLAAALAAAAPAAAQPAADAAADTPVWQLRLSSDRHSDALPLSAWGDDDWARLRPRAGRNLAYLDEQARLERRSGGLTLGLVARSQATLVAGRPALELAALLARGRVSAEDREWPVKMRLRGFAGAGVSLALDSPAEARWAAALAARAGGQWQASVSAEALALGRWRLRRIDGTVSLGDNGGADAFALRSDEHDDRLSAPFQRAFARRGAGLLLGGALQWQHGAWTARAALHDGGWLHWRGLPRQQLALDTDTLGVDADGFVQYRPLLTGQNSQRGFSQVQPWSATLALAHDFDDRRQAGVVLRQRPGAPLLPALQWRQRSGDLRWGLGWQLHERRASIDLAWRGLTLQAGADRLGAGAHSRSFSLGWQTTLP
jgi:hypothetical protein